MSTFPFLPRSVKRRKANISSEQDQVSSRVASVSTPAGAPIVSGGQSFQQTYPDSVKKKANEGTESQHTLPGQKEAISASTNKGLLPEDLACLVWLALSDYALWSDTDLRRKIDWAVDGQLSHDEPIDDLKVQEDHGYIPLRYLKQSSTIFLQAASSPSFTDQPDIAYVKAIRSHAAHLMDVRLVLSDDNSFVSDGWVKRGSSSTGYEVRRKNTPSTLSNHGKQDWFKLTIYVENIPVQYRTVHGIAKLISSLLPLSSHNFAKIQNISFPPHHNDRPGTLPTCKGFALVTLSLVEDVQYLLHEWPWEDRNGAGRKVLESDSQDIVKGESLKFGLRCLSKSDWEAHRAEYLIYRQQLIEEIDADNKVQEQISRITVDTVNASRPSKVQAVKENQPILSSEPQSASPTEHGQQPIAIRANSPYPPGCLVFVRNVHPETNKTSLRTLFSQSSKIAEQDLISTDSKNNRLDYVDYTKGLDSCYLRFSTPSYARSFVDYFASHPITQETGLDGAGKSHSSSPKDGSAVLAITPELVTGKREELYWQKVPEKVRKQAVDKAIKMIYGDIEEGVEPEQTMGKRRRR